MAGRRSDVTFRSTASPWRVRLRAGPGQRVLGAGILIDAQHLLTCAHVVAADPVCGEAGVSATDRLVAAREVTADLVGLPDGPSVSARPVSGAWVPRAADESGDVAVLRLDTPQRPGAAAPLYRLASTPGRLVRMCGFPRGLDGGLWVTATVGGPVDPRAEWVQLDPVPGQPGVSHGFSGAAVCDERGTAVLGMVVGRYGDATVRVSYMLPVESILKYLPALADRAGGRGAVDHSIVRRSGRTAALEDSPATIGFAQSLADWLARRGEESVWEVVVGEIDSALSSAVRRAIVLADRESQDRDDVAAASPDGTVPPIGSIDLALDVTGLSTEEVARRIVDRLRAPGADDLSPRTWLRSSAPPANLVIAGVDAAIEPEALVADVVGPLVRRGSRVLLVLRRLASRRLSEAVAAVRAQASDAVEERLRLLAERVRQLSDAEREAEEMCVRLRRRVVGVPAAPDGAVGSRLALSALRREAAEGGADRRELLAALESAERAVDRRRKRVDAVRRELDRLSGLADELGVLRGLLDAAAAKARDCGLAEDQALGVGYRSAHDRVWTAPCDVPAAQQAVRSYLDAVRRRCGEAAGR